MGTRTHVPGSLGPTRRGHVNKAQRAADVVTPGLPPSTVTLSGDVTGTGTGAVSTTIANNAVSFAKLADIPTDSLIGRDTAGTGDPESITLNATLEMDGSQHLRRAALTGDVTASAGSNSTTIANNAVTTAKIIDKAVTLAKMDDLANHRAIGRDTAGTGVPEAVTVSQILDWLSASVARGDLAMRGAATWDRLAPGTAGLALTSGGAAADLVYAKLLYAALQDVSATSRILGRKSGGSGVIEELTASDVLTILGISNAGSPIYSGAGHPQGVQSAPIGSIYVDTNNGYRYRKRGGASTAYGWYYEPVMGAGSSGPMPWNVYVPMFGTASPFAAPTSYGPYSQDTVNVFTGTTVNSQTRTLVSGNWYAQAQTGGTSGNTSAITTNVTVTSTAILDGDLDITVELRTGSSVANLRIWWGISSSTPTDTATLGSGSNGSIAFRYSTADGGDTTHWMGVTQINGAGNQSISSAMSTVNANQSYLLRIRFVRSGTPTAYFSVDDGTEVSLTTNIPATGSFYFPTLGWTTKENSAKVMLWKSWGASVGS